MRLFSHWNWGCTETAHGKDQGDALKRRQEMLAGPSSSRNHIKDECRSEAVPAAEPDVGESLISTFKSTAVEPHGWEGS